MGTFVRTGVRETFATRHATLSVESAYRFQRYRVLARSLFGHVDPLQLPVRVDLVFMSCF